MTDQVLFQDACESVSRYKNRTQMYEEGWKKEHNEAVKCLEFEEILVFGVSIYEFLNRLDEMWRLKVHKKQVEHDPKIDEAIERLYEAWLAPCDMVTARLDSFENAGYEVAGAKEFRSACREVKGLLTADSDFFRHQNLLTLRYEAIEEHRAGKSVELAELSD